MSHERLAMLIALFAASLALLAWTNGCDWGDPITVGDPAADDDADVGDDDTDDGVDPSFEPVDVDAGVHFEVPATEIEGAYEFAEELSCFEEAGSLHILALAPPDDQGFQPSIEFVISSEPTPGEVYRTFNFYWDMGYAFAYANGGASCSLVAQTAWPEFSALLDCENITYSQGSGCDLYTFAFDFTDASFACP